MSEQLVTSCVRIGEALTPNTTAQEQVRISDYRNFPTGKENRAWQYVARINDPSLRATYAEMMTNACNNSHVLYSMDYRTEVYNWIKSSELEDIANLDVDKHCDCSSLAAALLLYVGIDISQPSTSSLYGALSETGKFTIYDSIDYTMACDKLLVGDILWYSIGHFEVDPSTGKKEWVREAGHAAVVVYSEYDNSTEEYIDIPLKDRNQCYGRVTDSTSMTSDGAQRPQPDTVPINLCYLSDLELFLTGAAITGGKAIGVKNAESAKYIIVDNA